MICHDADTYYSKLLANVWTDGERLKTRNARCRRLVAQQVTFDRTPLIGLRKTAWKNCLLEWDWFMSGSSTLDDLHPAVRKWWEPWIDEARNVAFNYSKQFRHAQGGGYEANDLRTVDQIRYLIEGVKNHPNSRRNVVTTWNAAEMSSPECTLTNCHGTVIQAFVHEGRRLHLVTYQRSCDLVCGFPHNVFQYWAFLVWLAHRTGTEPALLTWIGGDCHVYEEHADLVPKILVAGYSSNRPITPNLVYRPSSDDFRADDFVLDGPYLPILTERAQMIV